MVRSSEPRNATSRELVPYSETEDSQLIQVALTEYDPVERARKLASLRGASEEFEALLEQNQPTYRSTPDLSALVLRAIDTKESALEKKVESTALDLPRSEYVKSTIGGYLKVLGGYLKEGIKGLIYPLLPGWISRKISSTEVKWDTRFAVYLSISSLYEAGLITALGGSLIGSYKAVGFLSLAILSVMKMAWCSMTDDDDTPYPLGLFSIELASLPIYGLYRGLKHFNERSNEEKQKLLEEKRQHLLQERKLLTEAKTPFIYNWPLYWAIDSNGKERLNLEED